MAVWHLNIPVNCLLVLRYFPPNRFVWNKEQHFIRIGLFLPKWINTPVEELQGCPRGDVCNGHQKSPSCGWKVLLERVHPKKQDWVVGK